MADFDNDPYVPSAAQDEELGGADAARISALLDELGIGNAISAVHGAISGVPGTDNRLSAAVVMLAMQFVETQTKLTQEIRDLRIQLQDHNQLLAQHSELYMGIERGVKGLGVRWDHIHHTLEARGAELAKKTGAPMMGHNVPGLNEAHEKVRDDDIAQINNGASRAEREA